MTGLPAVKQRATPKVPTHYVCNSGHEVSVQPWGTVPLACPACVHGVPCNQPLLPVRGRR